MRYVASVAAARPNGRNDGRPISTTCRPWCRSCNFTPRLVWVREGPVDDVFTVLRLAFAVILGWATYLLAREGGSDGPVTAVAAVAVATSAVAQFLSIANSWLGADIEPARHRVNEVVKNRLAATFRNGVIKGDCTSVSVHVWEVPILYRRLIPYRFRQALRKLFSASVQKFAWRPRLKRIGEGGLRYLPPSGISFRKGYGVVGMSLQINDHNMVHVADFEDREFVRALRQGPARWPQEPVAITRNLDFEAAEKLATRYSEALAIVIQHPASGEAIGCLTVEVERGVRLGLAENKKLQVEMRSVADLLGPMVARSNK
jgi:hypothetical protein